MKRLALVIIGLFLFHYSAQAEVPAVEREALVALYSSTNGAEWKNKSNWLTGDPCTNNWFGVTCYSSEDISKIDLRSNNLVGTIPAEFGNLENLQILNFSFNELNGSIAPELGNLAILRDLNLANNQLSGLIPSALGTMPKLKVLRLGWNELSGSVPPSLGSLAILQALDLRINHLSGPIPVELGLLSDLEVLRLEKNNLSGEIPLELRNLPRLSPGRVDVRWNALFTYDAELDTFLNDKVEHDWSATQTIAPENVWITAMGVHTARLAWDIIEYSAGNGRYHVSYSTTSGGPYMAGGATTTKTETELIISGLPANTRFYFVVQAETDHSISNTNNVMSDISTEVSGDTPVAPPGFFITPVSGLVTTEKGGFDTFDVTLDTQPNADVSITLTSSDMLEGIVSHDSLTFTSFDWNVPQTVTITGVDDDEADGNRQYTIFTGMASSADIDYDGIDPEDISVTNEDDGDVTTAALESLYSSTNGSEWNTNTNWLVGDPCKDNWHGVICDENANITQVKLGGNNLNGKLPIELGNMHKLRYLDLKNNRLTGVIPTGLGNLTDLRELRLNANNISGSIPGELGNLAQLQIMRLDQTLLSGSIPGEFGALTNLRDLWLYLSQLSGPIPSELGDMTNLQSLRINSNQLSGAIPSELGNLENLKSLRLAHNQLSGTIPATLGNLTELEDLNLNDNQLSGQLPVGLGNLGSLKYLMLYNNKLEGPMPSELGNLNNLKYMYIYNNQLDGAIPAEFGKLTNLLELHLHNNQLSGSIPADLGMLANLGQLYLQNNLLSGPVPTEMGMLNELYFLNLSDNHLSGSIPLEFGQMSNMSELHLHKNMLSGMIPTEIGNLTNLSSINLAGNQLVGPVPASFASLPFLGFFSDETPGVNLGWNALFTFDDDLDAFLDEKSESDWSTTQTVVPENIVVSAVGTDAVTLGWNPIEYTENEGGYRVGYGTSPGGPYMDGGITADKSSASYTVAGLSPGRDYYLVVTTETNSHSDNASLVISGESEEIFVTTSPAKPTGINATDGTYLNSVQVTFNTVADATVYRVFRCLDSGQTCGSPIGYPGGGSFDDRHAVPGTVYYYRVRACIANTCGKFSVANTGYASVQLPRPTGIRATVGKYPDRVAVSWNAVEGASVYRVFRCLDKGQTCGSPIGYPNGTSFDDRMGAAGTVYYYRVKACSTQHCSKFSVANAGHRSDTPALKKDETNAFLLPDQEVPIPTLSDWGKWFLTLMMLVFGLVLLNRQYQQSLETRV